MVTIDLIRHGEPEGGKRFRGHSVDDPLTEKGWLQMRSAIEGHAGWDAVVTSPLIRCLDFATEVSEQYDCPCDVFDGLKEVGFGKWEGKSRAIVRAMHAKEYALFYANPEKNTPPEAEQLGVFYRRVLATMTEIKQKYDDQHILLVAHAGVIRAILAQTLETPINIMYNMEIRNASLVQIELGEKNRVVF